MIFQNIFFPKIFPHYLDTICHQSMNNDPWFLILHRFDSCQGKWISLWHLINGLSKKKTILFHPFNFYLWSCISTFSLFYCSHSSYSLIAVLWIFMKLSNALLIIQLSIMICLGNRKKSEIKEHTRSITWRTKSKTLLIR